MWSECRWIPDNADSVGYGTRMRSGSVSPNGGSSPSVADANSQTPLRLRHSERVSCGRGYSGSALSGDTSWVHGVTSGGSPMIQPSAGSAAAVGVSVAASRADRAASTAPERNRRPRGRVCGAGGSIEHPPGRGPRRFLTDAGHAGPLSRVISGVKHFTHEPLRCQHLRSTTPRFQHQLSTNPPSRAGTLRAAARRRPGDPDSFGVAKRIRAGYHPLLFVYVASWLNSSNQHIE